MHLHAQRFKMLAVFVIAFLICCLSASEIRASSLSDQVEHLDVDRMSSLGSIKTAVALLDRSTRETIGGDDFILQKLVLMKSGACVSKLASLRNDPAQRAEMFTQEKKELFLANREVINRIYTRNEKTIREFQENRLDQMKDPLKFFQSPQWQHPHYLISLASYWLGWNGYYCSLLVPESDAKRVMLLEEAIGGFSRALIDFKEDAIITKSLFGRGLCYRQTKAYKSALADFKSIRDRIKKDDVLYVRCRYEEALISFQSGNFSLALGTLDKIERDVSGGDISKDLRVGLEELRAKVLLSLLKEKGDGGGATQQEGDKGFGRLFREMRELAGTHGGVSTEFYRFVQENVDKVARLPYADLGPVATVALGDWFFEKREYDKALQYYLMLQANAPSALKDRMDGVWFRTAYIYAKKSCWSDAIRFLEDFPERFPKSPLVKQAASLYYSAATSNYRKSATQASYTKLIDAVQGYLQHCRGTCPERSEAHFQLGKYYQTAGNNVQAVNEFQQVGQDSPNHGWAKYYILQDQVDKLEALEKTEQRRPEFAEKTFRDAVSVFAAYHRGDKTGYQREIEPQMIILEARLYLLGPDEGCKNSLRELEGFEARFPHAKTLFAKAAGLRIQCYSKLRMSREAGRDIEKLMQASPMDSERYTVLHDLANHFYSEVKRGQSPGAGDAFGPYAATALLIYTKLNALSEKNASYKHYCTPIKLRMAELYMAIGKPEDAIAAYRDILEKDSSSADAVYNLGLLYEERGEWREALETWRRFSDGVREGTPHWFESRYGTAYAFNKLGEKEKACQVLTMTLVLHPDLGSDALRARYLALKSETCEGK